MRCKHCGRPLKDHNSIDRGYGPTCYLKRPTGFVYQIELRFNPRIVGSMKDQHEIVKRIISAKD